MAKPVDAYANCFVRRDRHLSELHAPAEVAAGIQLSDLSGEGGK
jgi:hypothetical protein